MKKFLSPLLFVALVVCAFVLVWSQNQARHLFMAHEKSVLHAKNLNIEWERLLLEERNFSKGANIEAQALAKGMVRPPANQTIYVNTQ